MRASICYFTGTGNSLYVARELASRIGADLMAMKSVVGSDKIVTDADCIGMVFPVYNHRIPYIVKRFIERLHTANGTYLFAVCTYGGSPCISLSFLAQLLREKGLALSLGCGVKMPYNYIHPESGLKGLFRPFVLHETPEEEIARILSDANDRITAICEDVKAKKRGHIQTEYERLERAIDLLGLRVLQKNVWLKVGGYKGKTNLSCIESVQLMDAGFFADGDCVRCGTCAAVCPVHNIVMTADGPNWQHHCEQCFACLQWCPQLALQFTSGTAGRKRYHHPAVSLSDMR
ncbi:MAG: EFR1 family ferrodoxin [Bacillota bacterium]